MKQFMLLFFCISASAFAVDDFKQVMFLEGCWKGTIENSTVYESWGNSEGRMMLGTSKTVTNEKVESFEFLSILSLEGKIQYVPYVNGSRSVSFPLTGSSAGVIEFSNPAHDFPKKIRYELQGSRLMIRLSGDGPNIAYDLNRIACSSEH